MDASVNGFFFDWLAPRIIVLIVFPVVAVTLNAPFFLIAVLAERFLPHPGPMTKLVLWAAVAVQAVVVFGGALGACWWVWPRTKKRLPSLRAGDRRPARR